MSQKSDPGLAPVTKRLEEILQYNTVGGKLNRGCAVVHTAELLGCSNLFHANVLGWCVEILQVLPIGNLTKFCNLLSIF